MGGWGWWGGRGTEGSASVDETEVDFAFGGLLSGN